MNCKFCQAELEEGNTLCPVCGKDNGVEQTASAEDATVADEMVVQVLGEETAEATAQEFPVKPENKAGAKLTPGKLALIVVAVIAVVAVLVALVWSSMNGNNETLNNNATGTSDVTDTATGGSDATVETTEATIPANGNPNDVTCKGTYTVTDEEVIAAKDTVVATVEDKTLTNSQLQVYYWMQVYDFMSNYGSYASIYGIDFTSPLDTQVCSLGEGTWQQYFLQNALDTWHMYQAVCVEAELQNHEMNEEFVEQLASLETTLTETAQSNGFETVEDMIKSDLGPGSTFEAYQNYMQVYYESYSYYNAIYESMVPTDTEIEKYYDDNAESFQSQGVEKNDSVLVDVRHILFQPEGGTTGEDGTTTYSDEEWAACEQAAQAVLDAWLAGDMTEDSFAELANEHSEDPGSNTNGGLYQYVGEGEMVTEFNDWCFDSTRQVGDYGLVKTTYGYHVMYFSGSMPTWYVYARESALSQMVSEQVKQIMEDHAMEVAYSDIALGFVSQTAVS